MKSFITFFFFIIFLIHVTAQTDNKIVLGTIDSVQSKILQEQRKIWVYVPNSEPNNIYAKRRYPVVYLLDGDAHFYSVVGMIQQLSSVNGNMIYPEMIVVGIPNTDRTRDLTPTHVDVDPPYVDSGFARTSGGGENFTSFIEKELIPYIDSLYPTAPYKMLIGHSFGGLMVINTIIKHPHLFNAYVAIDPSMWWNQQKLLKESKKVLATQKFPGISLYLGIANTMEEGMDIKMVQKDTSADTKHIRSILELKSYLEANKQNGLKYQGKYYGNDSHGSVPLITEYDALRFIFDYYPLKLTTKDYMDTTTVMADKYDKHFKNISKQIGYPVKPAEELINGMGYDVLNGKFFKTAESFFKLNIANYPESYNVYDSYGDYYVAKGDTANAIIYFKKALSIQENEGSRQKLNELSGENLLHLSVEALQKYVGVFTIPDAGVTIKTFINDKVLMVSATGQPEAELYSTKQDEFQVKNAKGYLLRFDIKNEKESVLYVTAPDRSFTAKKQQ
jgi:uncharacterized protein